MAQLARRRQPVEILTYRLWISSHLPEDWSAKPGVMTMELGYDEHAHPLTTLLLAVPDRTALMGVLNEMHVGHLAIVAIAQVTNQPLSTCASIQPLDTIRGTAR